MCVCTCMSINQYTAISDYYFISFPVSSTLKNSMSFILFGEYPTVNTSAYLFLSLPSLTWRGDGYRLSRFCPSCFRYSVLTRTLQDVSLHPSHRPPHSFVLPSCIYSCYSVSTSPDSLPGPLCKTRPTRFNLVGLIPKGLHISYLILLPSLFQSPFLGVIGTDRIITTFITLYRPKM